MGYYLAKPLFLLFGPSSVVASVLIILLSMIICAFLGVVIERFAYRPIRSRAKLTMLITAIGVSLFLEFGGQLLFGPDPKLFPSLVPNFPVIHTQSVVLSSVPIIVVSVSLLLMLLLRFLVLKTRIGIAMRAVAQNPQAASLMGINLDRIISFTFAVGSALAAAAGILYATLYPSINPLMGIFPGLKAFIAAVLGGIGNIPAAVLGGFMLGLIETFVTGYVSATYRDAIAFGILIFILLFRPAGLLGSVKAEKV